MFADISQIKPALDAHGQSHLYKYWDELSDEDKNRYFNEIVSIKLGRVNSAYKVFSQIFHIILPLECIKGMMWE